MSKNMYDVLIFTTVNDFLRLKSNYGRLVRNMPGRSIIFVGNHEVGEQVERAELGERVFYLDEGEILPFQQVDHIMQEALQWETVPRGITGWYYQQFLKMQYSYLCRDSYYMVWDGDTIPCKTFEIFGAGDIPYFDLKREYHEEYFVTLAKLFPGMQKCMEPSFISEHMLINSGFMKQMIAEIEENKECRGKYFYEKIIYAIDREKLTSNSFSEFETYGTWVWNRYPYAYQLRTWHSFRYGGQFFDPDTISDSDYEWLGRDFAAISFEKENYVREDQKDIFTKKEYQEKLSARQILEIAQQEFEEGYLEVWDD